MLELEDITAGSSYACKFRTRTFVDAEGAPVRATNLQLGQAHPGTPGEYQGLGVIRTRDVEQRLLRVVDTASNLEFTVSWDDVWDVDTIDWIE